MQPYLIEGLDCAGKKTIASRVQEELVRQPRSAAVSTTSHSCGLPRPAPMRWRPEPRLLPAWVLPTHPAIKATCRDRHERSGPPVAVPAAHGECAPSGRAFRVVDHEDLRALPGRYGKTAHGQRAPLRH